MDGPGAVGELAQAAGVGGESDHLHENGQPFLGHGRRGRPLRRERADRLVEAIECGAHVHQAFVDLQCAHVSAVEHRVGTHLDVIGTGRSVGHDTVGLEHADGLLGLAEDLVQAPLKDRYGFLGGKVLRLVLQVAPAVDVVQIIGQHQAQVGQGRVAGMEGVGGRAIQLLGNQAEILGATGFEHAHHHAVLLAHAPHDLPDRVELTELASDVALDALELGLHRVGIERQRSPW